MIEARFGLKRRPFDKAIDSRKLYVWPGLEELQALLVFREALGDDGLEQLPLAAEVAIDGFLGDARITRHRVDAGAAATNNWFS